VAVVRKCLSVRQPFLWAIAYAGCRVVNRELLNVPSYRGPVVIHVAKPCTYAEFATAIEWMRKNKLVRLPTEVTRPPLPQIPLLTNLFRGGFALTADIVDIHKNTKTGHVWTKVGLPCSNGCGVVCPSARQVEDPSYPKLHKCPNRNRWEAPGVLGIVLDNVKTLPVCVPWEDHKNFFHVKDAELALCIAALLANSFVPAEVLLRSASQHLLKKEPIGIAPLLRLVDKGILTMSHDYFAFAKEPCR
jgi:hypothetical protein